MHEGLKGLAGWCSHDSDQESGGEGADAQSKAHHDECAVARRFRLFLYRLLWVEGVVLLLEGRLVRLLVAAIPPIPSVGARQHATMIGVSVVREPEDGSKIVALSDVLVAAMLNV